MSKKDDPPGGGDGGPTPPPDTRPPGPPNTVSPEITDAVASTGLTVLGDAPAMAMAQIYQSLAHSTGLMFQNAVTAQQNMNITSQAATVQGIVQIYGLQSPQQMGATTPTPRASAASDPNLGVLIETLIDVVREVRRG